jgi:poly(A) polymerase
MFGQYLEEKGGQSRAGGVSPQQAMDRAVAEFLEELVPTVQVPNKVALQVRSILGCQARFRKTPGKQPLSFLRRICFGEALDYLGIIGDITGESRELHAWWEKFRRDNPLSSVAAPAGEEVRKPEAGRGRRRRRRKREPAKSS